MKRPRQNTDELVGGSKPVADVAALTLDVLLDSCAERDLQGETCVLSLLEKLQAVICDARRQQVTWQQHGRDFPSLPLRHVNGTVSDVLDFQPPSRVIIHGEYALNTSIGSPVIDVAAVMPTPCLKARDVKNYSYSDKRCMYLGVLASSVEASGLFSSVQVTCTNGDCTKPALLLRPWVDGREEHSKQSGKSQPGKGRRDTGGKASEGSAPHLSKSERKLLSGLRIRLSVACEASSFSLSVLAPQWNNVRPWVWRGREAGAGDEGTVSDLYTPRYNACIGEDMTLAEQHSACESALSAVPAARHALLVLKLWARRQGWHTTQDGFTAHLLTCIVAYCVQQSLLVPGMTAVQACRAVFKFLSLTDLTHTPLVLRPADGRRGQRTVDDMRGDSDDDNEVVGDDEDEEEDDDAEEEEEDEEESSMQDERESSSSTHANRLVEVTPEVIAAHRASYPVVILCPSGLVNLAWRVSAGAAQEMKACAALALNALGTGNAASAAASASAAEAAAAAAPSAFDLPLFQQVFSQSTPLPARYDRLVTAPLPAWPLHGQEAAQGQGEMTKQDNAGSRASQPPPVLLAQLCQYESWSAAVAQSAERVITSALTDRVSLVRVFPVFEAQAGASVSAPCPEHLSWPLSSPPPVPTCLWIAVNVDPGNATRLVDRGPSADDTGKVAAFLDLWGSLSAAQQQGGPGAPVVGRGLAELRKFADGALVYAVVWEASRLGGRGYARDWIIPLAISHVLARHCGIAMPVGCMHAGDALLVTRAGGGKQESSEAGAALLYADMAHACQSLALERVLEQGAQGATLAKLTYGGKGKSSVNAAPVYSPITGIPQVALPSVAGCTIAGLAHGALPPTLEAADAEADPLARGPLAAVSSARQALDFLHAALRTLPGMPLGIAGIQVTSPALRYTGMHTPAPHALATGKDATTNEAGKTATAAGQARPIAARALLTSATVATESLEALAAASGQSVAGQGSKALDRTVGSSSSLEGPVACQTVTVHEVIVTLSPSSRWPSDLPALSALKTAFYLKLKYGLSTATQGLAACHVQPQHLDVLLGGYAFRLILSIDKELALLQAVAGRAPLAKSQQRTGKAGQGAHGEEEGQGPAKRHAGNQVVGFINIAPAGATAPEPSTRLSERKAVAAKHGVPLSLVSKGPMGKADLAARMKAIFRRGIGVAPLAGATGDEDDAEVEQLLASTGVGRTMTATSAASELDALYMRCVVRPQHALAVHAFVQRFPSYAPAVRLVSLWLSAHMLGPEQGWRQGSAAMSDSPLSSTLTEREGYMQGIGPAMPQEVIELLVARIYASPAPYASAPGSASCAFYRFLRLLLSWDWVHEPMMVDWDGALQPGDARALQARFKQVRSGSSASAGGGASDEESTFYPPRLPAAAHPPSGPALYIVTPAQREQGWRPVWSKASPSWAVLGRLLSLAATAERSLATMLCPILPRGSTPAGTSAALPVSVTGQATTLHSLAEQDGASTGVAALQALFTEDSSPFHVLLHTSPAMVPRLALDGRTAGPVKAPLPCALALTQAHKQVAALLAGLPADANRSGPILLPLGVAADKSKYQLPLFRNLLPTSRAALLVGFQPVDCLARALRTQLAGHALVCVEGAAGSKIGVVWRPGTFALRASGQGAEKEQAAELQAQLLPVLHSLAQGGSGMLRAIELQ